MELHASRFQQSSILSGQSTQQNHNDIERYTMTLVLLWLSSSCVPGDCSLSRSRSARTLFHTCLPHLCTTVHSEQPHSDTEGQLSITRTGLPTFTACTRRGNVACSCCYKPSGTSVTNLQQPQYTLQHTADHCICMTWVLLPASVASVAPRGCKQSDTSWSRCWCRNGVCSG